MRDAAGNVIAGETQLTAVAGALRAGMPMLQNGDVGEEPVRVAALQIVDPRNVDANLTVEVAETLNKRKALTEAMRTQAVALPQVLVLVVAILLIVYGYTYVLRPMQQLRALIDNRGSNDLSPLDPDSAPHDLRPLIESINGLMDRLALSVAAQRRFIADAAHQLRTPLAGIKSQTERALVERDPAAVRAALRQLAAGTEHATELANRLLTLARAGTPLTAPPTDVDLMGVVRDTIAEHLPQALERRHDLGYRRPAAGHALHRPRRCVAAARNAVESRRQRAAVLASRGAITVSIDRDGSTGSYTLAVSDTGPGIPADERERVFEPFYQVRRRGCTGYRARPRDRADDRARPRCDRIACVGRGHAGPSRSSSGSRARCRLPRKVPVSLRA